ncbi:MAG TPA: hypothetical protein VF995_04330, partial [Actinomycetota bacterium]
MRGLVLALSGALTLAMAVAGCGSGAGATGAGSAGSGSAGAPGRPAQAAAAALAFATGSDAEVAVVDGFTALPAVVQRGQQPLSQAGGNTKPCAKAPQGSFTPSERAALQVPFQGRTLR